jgi:hypothetical protein
MVRLEKLPDKNSPSAKTGYYKTKGISILPQH